LVFSPKESQKTQKKGGGGKNGFSFF